MPFIGALLLISLWRLLAAIDAQLPLSVDEAQYFLWSLTPDWGYYSKPPLIAWTIALATPICGEGELCIRMPALALFLATSICIASIARRLLLSFPGMASNDFPFAAGLAFASLPLTGFYSWAMTTDSLLLFCWSLALLFFLRALETDAWRDWLICGLAVGIGLLAKYSMGLFLLSALLFLLITQKHRLATAKPWVAALLASSLLAPNLHWNLTHQMATLRHTAEISQLDRSLFHPVSLVLFFAAQFGVMGPLFFPTWIAVVTRRASWQAAPIRALAAFSLPVLALFLLLALLSRAHANWAAPAYPAATLLAVAWLIRTHRRRWLVAAIAVNFLLTATLYHWHRLAPALGVALSVRTDPFHKLRGWPAAGKALAQLMQQSGCDAVATADRSSLVELAYYTRRASGKAVAALAYNPSRQIRNHFELTADIATRPFRCALLVGDFAQARLEREFTAVEPLAALALPPGEQKVWKVVGFRGYAAVEETAQ